MTPIPTPPSARDTALSAYRAVFDAAPGTRRVKHSMAYSAVFGAVTDIRFDLHEDVYVIVDAEADEIEVRVAA
jgi:hypothetical protein